jgi:hypothetical protein
MMHGQQNIKFLKYEYTSFQFLWNEGYHSLQLDVRFYLQETKWIRS